MSSAEQVADGVVVFGAIQAMKRLGAAGIRRGGRGAIELGLEPGQNRRLRRCVRPRPARRRHQPRAKLARDLFPRLRLVAHPCDIERVEREPGLVFARSLWQPTQYRSRRARCCDSDVFSDVEAGEAVPA